MDFPRDAILMSHMGEGNWRLGLLIDEDASDEQTEKLARDGVDVAVAPCSPFSVTKELMRESAELARRLEEYRRMKEAAGWLTERLTAERDRFFSAAEAKEMGLVHKVVEASSLEKTTREYCDMLAANAPLTMRTAKRLIHALTRSPREFDVEKAKGWVKDCFESADYVEEEEGQRQTARQILTEVDPSLPLSRVESLEQLVGESVASRRFIMLLLAVVMAVLLVVSGPVAQAIGDAVGAPVSGMDRAEIAGQFGAIDRFHGRTEPGSMETHRRTNSIQSGRRTARPSRG